MRRLWLLTLGLTLILSACSCYIKLTASGSLPESIAVQVSEPQRIEAVSVDRQEGKGHWVRIWDATGKAKVSSITYGVVPKGMHQLKVPEPLRRLHIYHAMIHTPPTFFGPPCGGGVVFWIAANGQLRTCISGKCEERLLAGKIPE